MNMGFEFQVGGQRVQNMLTRDGQEAFLRKIFLDGGALFSQGAPIAELFIGLCDQAAGRRLVLTDIFTEPQDGTGGYQRMGMPLSNMKFKSNHDFVRMIGTELTFTATGADWSSSVSRFFVATTPGNTGRLISISAPLYTRFAGADGTSLAVQPSFTFYN